MANNRLFILNTVTGEEFMLAKSYGRGWCVSPGWKEVDPRLPRWLRDWMWRRRMRESERRWVGELSDWLSAQGDDLTCAIGGRPRTVLTLVDENHRG